MHEVFLRRLASHPKLRNDANFRVFLEYTGDVSFFFFCCNKKKKKKKIFFFFFDRGDPY
jgi:hypothetical protein